MKMLVAKNGEVHVLLHITANDQRAVTSINNRL
jgi:deferrochelatase/peroxidase EfeB